MLRATSLLLSLVVLCAAPARADILYLKDGRILNGPDMERVESGVMVHFENGDVSIAADMILESIVGGASTFEPRTDVEKEQVAKGLVPFQGRWMSPAKREREMEKFLAERRQAIADEESHRLWRNRRMEKTKHFEFEYTVPQHIFEYYRDLMEAYFTTFAKDWNVKQPKAVGRLKVCFYIDRESFLQVGGVGGGVAGYFRFVPPLELNFYYDRLDPEFTEDVLFHETNHYLTKLMNLDFAFPHFPGESLAEYYGASDFDAASGKLLTGLVQEGRLTEIQTDIAAGELMSIEKLITTDGMGEHYSWGWSLVHFLMQDPQHQKKFQKFVLTLAKDRDLEFVDTVANLKTVRGEEIFRVFKKQMGIKDAADLDALEKAWHAYVQEQLELATPRGKEKAAAAAMGTYPSRPIRAKRLFSEAIAEGSTNPIAFHKYAELLEMDGKHDEAVAMWRRAIELDPLNPQFYAYLGRALTRRGDNEEGERLKKLAVEIDPDYAWSIQSLLDAAIEEPAPAEE